MSQEEKEWSDIPEIRFARETASREGRLERLRQKIDVLFPPEKTPESVRQAIEDSLHVPQWGKYHNEGVYMDTHFDRILEVIDEVRAGVFPEGISTEIQQLLLTATQENKPEELEKYAFTHDIEKRDCLLLKKEDGSQQAIEWDAWEEMIGDLASDPHPERLVAWLKEQGIESISYYHPADKKAGKSGKQHGNTGVGFLEKQGYGMSSAMSEAIASHEVAFQFDKQSAIRYRKNFSHMTTEERNFALLASFSDTMSSYRDNGKPDLTNFIALAESCRRLPLLEQLETSIGNTNVDLDPKKVEAAMAAWDAAGSDDVDAVFAHILETCKAPEKKRVVYDLQKLESDLLGAVDEQIAGEIMTLVRAGREDEIRRHYGSRLGAAMGKIRGALKAAQQS